MSNRTHKKHCRVYLDGNNLSSHAMDIGPLAWLSTPEGQTALTDAAQGFFPGVNTIVLGTLNTIFDDTATTGSQPILKTIGGKRVISVPFGMGAAPVSGNPCFAGEFEQKDYKANGEGMVTASVEFEPSARATSLLYARPWGNVIHAKGAETGANTGESDHENEAGQTTAGGFMVWQLFTADGTGTVTMSIEDDEATDGSYTSLVSSGAIDAATDPIAGLVALGQGVTVDTFTRWQVAFGGNTTTATFFLSFHRG